MNFLAWIAIASLYKIDPEENEHLKDHCGARHLDVPNYRCTGTLISKRHVLTAAHCVYDLSQALKDVGSEEQCTPNGKLLPPLDMTVYLGTKCPKLRKCPNGEKRTTYKARHIIPHPDFTVCPQAANDIAVIELDKDANPEEASPVCMPEEDDSVLGRTVTGIGYGIDARDRPDKFRPGLQELNLAAIYEGDGRIEAKGFEVAMVTVEDLSFLLMLPAKRFCSGLHRKGILIASSPTRSKMSRRSKVPSLMYVIILTGFATLQVFVHFEQSLAPVRLRMVKSWLLNEVHSVVEGLGEDVGSDNDMSY
ncbi:trypsin [Ancylostoma ceylanicum]|uniref:Trypsin n=1 Tax=Ancylostoma ceylanicum TaxID=53326 RepID=A0A0D6MBL9_9BILA|nr:trypsin [Ancylostoma ceylanicum]